FQGNSAQTVCFKVMNVEPVPVTTFQHEVPPALDAIISRAIAKDPDDRYRSGAEFSRDLQEFREGDQSFAEATSFFARVIAKDLRTANAAQSRLEPYRRLSSAGVIFSAALALVVLGWRVSRVHNSSLPPAIVSEMRPAPIHATNPAPPVPTIAKPAAHKKQKTKEPVQDTAPLAPENSKVQVEIQHHFTDARAAGWFDDELVFDQD